MPIGVSGHDRGKITLLLVANRRAWRSLNAGTAAFGGSLPMWRTACRKMRTCSRKWRRRPASCSCSFKQLAAAEVLNSSRGSNLRLQ